MNADADEEEAGTPIIEREECIAAAEDDEDIVFVAAIGAPPPEGCGLRRWGLEVAAKERKYEAVMNL